MKGSVCFIQPWGLREIGTRTGGEDALHLPVVLKRGSCDFVVMLMLPPVNHASPVQSNRWGGKSTWVVPSLGGHRYCGGVALLPTLMPRQCDMTPSVY